MWRMEGGRWRERTTRFEGWVEIRIRNLENRESRESLEPDARSSWDASVRNLCPSRRNGDSLSAPLLCHQPSLARGLYTAAICARQMGRTARDSLCDVHGDVQGEMGWEQDSSVSSSLPRRVLGDADWTPALRQPIDEREGIWQLGAGA